jgi:hypothetical protein
MGVRWIITEYPKTVTTTLLHFHRSLKEKPGRSRVENILNLANTSSYLVFTQPELAFDHSYW